MTDKPRTQIELDRLIDKFDYAMLITRSLEGSIRARPMMIAGHTEGARLYFATRVEQGKFGEILHDSNVAVTLQGSNRFLSISGWAELEVDPDLVRRFWSKPMQVWFPEGVDDPQLTLIRIEPVFAEFWDQSGFNRLEVLWESGKALITGEIPREDPLGAHAKVLTS